MLFTFLLLTLTLVPAASLKVVAFGDSFSSGNGARDENGERNFFGPPECRRSQDVWIAKTVKIFDLEDEFMNFACSGADTNELSVGRSLPSVAKDGSGACPSPSSPDETITDLGPNSASCSRFLKPQLDFVDSTIDVVTLTIGANDLNLADTVDDCLVPPRDSSDCQANIDQANNRLTLYEESLKNLLLAFAERLSSSAVVILVTYPYLALDKPFDYNGVELTNQFRDFGDRLDTRQGSAVAAANAEAGRNFTILFDETKSIFAGREADPSSTSATPGGWIWEVDGFVFGTIQPGIAPAEVYHPNPEGHKGLSAGINTFFRNKFMLVQIPTPAPVSPTDPNPSTFFCFSGDTLVTVETRGDIPMKALQVGDRVLGRKEDGTGSSYVPIVGFFHTNDEEETTFLQLSTSDNTDLGPLEISASHFVFSNGVPKRAGNIQPGDMIDGGGIVTHVRQVVRRGFYAPASNTGRVVVSGVEVSTYVAFLDGLSEYPTLENSIQYIATKPWLWYCGLTGGCPKSQNTFDGMAGPIYVLSKIGKAINTVVAVFRSTLVLKYDFTGFIGGSEILFLSK